MRRTAILGVNDDENYIGYWPYVVRAWNNLGWETLTFYLGSDDARLIQSPQNAVVRMEGVEGYRDSTVVQTIRLLGHQHVDEGIIMTSDVDMMPLSDYWRPSHDEITVYGFDLTGYSQVPMCYIAASVDNWRRVIPEKSIEGLLGKYPCAKSNAFKEYWYTDQKIATERIVAKPHRRIDRGKEKGLAKGRVDRVRWQETKHAGSPKIDAHLPRPFDVEVASELLWIYHGISPSNAPY